MPKIGRVRVPRTPPRPRRRKMPRELRRALLWATPAILGAAVYALVLAGRTAAGQATIQRAGEGFVAASASLGLVVTDIDVVGRHTTDPATIMEALGAQRGTPILAVDPMRAKEKLQALPWVRSAAIERRLPGTLFVRLVERQPLAVWQHAGKHELIGRDGEVIPVTDLTRFAKLPTIVGDDAPKYARDFIDMLSTEPDLFARVTAAVRVGGRRWDVHIDRGIDVMLPEEHADGAWTHLAELERKDALLNRDVQTVDMRLRDRLVIRTIAAAPKDTVPVKKTPRPVGKAT
ncbi:MAG TPA: FtsQ-type POTRA domain-containing protein [Stellaceae bacterium]|nr:FtsQ-type POTRA domain-containing protein [Stellaceae bacterium]